MIDSVLMSREWELNLIFNSDGLKKKQRNMNRTLNRQWWSSSKSTKVIE